MRHILRRSRKKDTPVRYRKKEPLKFTALLYLKEALLNEEYENCAEIISLAYELGAKEFEVQDLLEDPRRAPG